MSTNGKESKFKRQLEALEQFRRDPANSPLRPRDRIRIRMRCRLCGRGRAVYRKFGICRICLRDKASDGLIPGMRKASW